MEPSEEMAWHEQIMYWREKRDILKTEKEYWKLKLEMLKRADIEHKNKSRI